MFDDPNKELRRLQDELLAEEDWQEEEEEDWLEDTKALLEEADYPKQQVPYRNFANGYGRYDQEEELEEESAYLREDYRKDRKQAKKEKGLGGLLLLAFLELMGILAIVIWWVLWLL